MKILLLVFIYLTLKKSNFLFLLCFKIAIIKFIPNTFGVHISYTEKVKFSVSFML